MSPLVKNGCFVRRRCRAKQKRPGATKGLLNETFIESVYRGQRAVRNRAVACELITYTLQRVKELLKWKPSDEER